MSTKTREELLKADYIRRIGCAYNNGPYDALDEVAKCLAELATQRQPVGDDHGPVCREPQDIDGLAKLLGGGERLKVIDVDTPAPAPVEAVTSDLEAVLGDSYVLGNDRSGATRKRIIAAAKADQLAARAQDQARIAELEQRVAEVQRISDEYIASTDPVLSRAEELSDENADLRQQVERLKVARDANATAERELATIRKHAEGRPRLISDRQILLCQWFDELDRLLGLADTSGEVGR
jgi:hypothetical protein